ncbi:DEAD/DEAH box helicase family protein [uncultured Gemella sp.]|uniref:type III restriction-modification system endonuclease n=1 Tax=uncultured Gemella sp. TaxID=254352 RepID=UPI0028D5C91E|nr:DEAD/DEAH box helicase family protein [uncultured Gemella sp.]
MKLQFKHQKFQKDAARAVVDVFSDQPLLTSTYMIDSGDGRETLLDDFTGWRNEPIIPGLTDSKILENINTIQKENNIKVSEKLEGRYNLTIEMETGVGKTYTYIKTMYELNKKYGWSKFIVVVPSVAIREGVHKSFEITQDHFAEEYGKKIRYFVYNSSRLNQIEQFASDNSINVMIINSQAFNATGKNARRIYMKLDEFRSRRPIDVIAKTNPIVIIDEPQSVEGKKTKENLEQFNALMTLRYSATHKKDSIYNMVYRLDALEAYNKKLVKRISVKGITETGSSSTEGYVYLEGINLSKAAPTATIQFDYKTSKGIKKITRIVNEGFNLYDNSGELEEYKNGFTITKIDGRDNSIEFINGKKIYAGDVIGNVNEDVLRRIQIRETILSHIERERELFNKGIKVLSLFFIDEVAKYKCYDEAGSEYNGIYAQMFEEEYNDIVSNLKIKFGETEYQNYLNEIDKSLTHAGYFSIDKKGKLVDSELKRNEMSASGENDIDTYDLIMKNKELLLNRDPKKSPVRFIFSHSALREGWDNPNVFQICTLKQSTSDVRKRQEVGRGLRLCVNDRGDRMDANALGNEVHNVNVLTIIASESYDSFAKGLQSEFAEAVSDRPVKITEDLFIGRVLKGINGEEIQIDSELAYAIQFELISNKYIDKKHTLTDKYYEDKKNGTIEFDDELMPYVNEIVSILDSVYDNKLYTIEDARQNNVELKLDENKLAMKEFKELWKKINSKSIYVVDFDTEELIEKAINALDQNLAVTKLQFKVESGVMNKIKSKEELLAGKSFVKEEANNYTDRSIVGSNVKYDLIGKIVEGTDLTRKAVVRILQGIKPYVFEQFKFNPEEFILKTISIINSEKATAVIEHITYNVMEEKYDVNIFTDATIKGKLDVNAMKAKKHLYDHIVYDSTNEKRFASDLDINNSVAVYVKLPNSFYISTPVGKYNPDWAIAFHEGSVKHVYFIAETKGSMDSLELRTIEQSKIHCAKKHFKAISNNEVVYDVVDNYESLLNLITR